MNTKKILLSSALSLALFAVNATGPAVTAPAAETVRQCGVTNAQITTYLQECSHHHTVYWVQDIPGTCNSTAGVNGCQTATVFVNGGSIVGHADAAGFCE